MRAYLDALQKVLDEGHIRPNRTGINTISKFGLSIDINLQDGYPLLTTKRIFFKGVIGELVWFLHGDSNIKFLQDNNIHIWDNWANSNGELGPIYGVQWRNWSGIDQIKTIIRQIKNEPYSRRIILSSWNVQQLPDMALPPCHILAQFYIDGRYISCSIYQRSADMFLGLPFDIASYAALTQLIGTITGYSPGTLIYNIGDAHIYTNHIEQVREQLLRVPKQLPQLQINEKVDIDNLSIDEFTLINYNPYPSIKAPVAI